MKKFRNLIIILSMLVLLTSCKNDSRYNFSTNRVNSKDIYFANEDSSEVSGKIVNNTNISQDTKNESDKIKNEDNDFEMRNTALWIAKSDFKNLTLDGASYSLNNELIELMNYSKIYIKYPIAIINGEIIYDIEDNVALIYLSNIKESLTDEWGISIAPNGYSLSYNLSLGPSDFNYIRDIAYSSDKKLMAFSIQSCIMDTVDSIIGIYDISSQKIRFISLPFYGELDDIEWSADSKNIAYAYFTGGDVLTTYIGIVESDMMKIIEIFSVADIIGNSEFGNAVNNECQLRVNNLYWEENRLYASVEVRDQIQDEVNDIEINVWEKNN